MKTRRQLAEAPGNPRPMATFTTDSNVTALAEGGRMTRRRSSAWDPYEVWRTRVKGEHTPTEDAEASPAA